MGTATNILIQKGNSHYFINLLVIVPIILDQDVDYCSSDFGSSCWLLFTLFWIKMLVTVQIILFQAVDILIQNNRNNDQQTDKKMETVANSLIQNNGNSNQHSDPKR
jgi:uncharacterized membrane protein